MILRNKKIGFAMTGSFCTLADTLPAMQELVNRGAIVTPIFSYHVYDCDTRFFKALELRQRVEAICGQEGMHTLMQTEPIGPRRLLDMVVVAPCTGNSAAKLALGIIDTPALMAAKSQLRNGGPVVIGISTNDGMGNSAKNIGMLANMKNVYLVPYYQDDIAKKPNSVVADMRLIPEVCELALQGKQYHPILLRRGGDD